MASYSKNKPSKNKTVVISNPDVVPEPCQLIRDHFQTHLSITLARDKSEDLQKAISQAIHNRNFANSVRISLAVPPQNPSEDDRKLFDQTKIRLNTAAEFAIVQYNNILEELFKISSYNLDGNAICQQKSIAVIKSHIATILATHEHFTRVCGQAKIGSLCLRFHMVCVKEKIVKTN